MNRRLAAVLGLVALLAVLVLLVVTASEQFPRGLLVVVLVAVAAVAGWQGLVRSGSHRAVLWTIGVLVLLAAVAVVLVGGLHLTGLAAVVLLWLSMAASKRAFSVHVRLPAAPAPQRAVVVWNPKSGGGKALSNNLEQEARRRGIEPIELKPGDDLVALVRDAVAKGADGLAAAGGDGTQALVATIAAEHDLPFACIPAGTRNHFALDLGVDRDDVVGALDAFVNGGEKRIDLGDVGGRVFVNNVSLGVYAQAVQSKGYRDAKIRTLLETVPAVVGAEAAGDHELRWTGPDGAKERSAAVILVSNNAYRLGRAIGSGTRPRMDAGQLGVAVVGGAAENGHRQALRQWTTEEFVIESDSKVPVGVDGEALVMPTPLVFRCRPGALRVRIAPQHPGASPSAAQPTGVVDAVTRLTRIALASDPEPTSAT
ncbi:MAG: diacylglycerol kinase family protein [Actinomycetes bacterium]